MMKIDDASSSRCEVISNYKFISAAEDPDSINPVFGDVSSTIATVPKSNVCSKQMLSTSKPYKATLCSSLGDDGYITDSMSSIAGSSSSSLSSNWTEKSRVYAGAIQGKATSQTEEGYMCSKPVKSGTDSAKDVNTSMSPKTKMQLGLAQDHYKFPESNRVDLYKYLGHDTRRRDGSLQTPTSVSSIEDRLGALTTIDEETPGASNDHSRVNAYCGRSRFNMCTGARIQQSAVHSPAVRRYQKKARENPHFGGDSNYEFLESEYFRTAAPAADVGASSLPVSLSTRNHQSEEEHCRIGARSLCCRNGSTDSLLSAPSPQMNEEGWGVYSSFLEKHFDIPPHNIDPAGRGKFLPSNVDDIPGMETKSQRFSPAHSLGERSKPTISGNRALKVSGSEFSLNRMGQTDRPYLYLKSGEQDQGLTTLGSEFSNNSYSRGMSFSHSRQTHVRSSMPDLRCQDTSSERDSEFAPDSFHGYRFHHYQQNAQQNYEHPQSHDHPHFRMQQQQNALPSIMDQCTQTHRNYSPSMNAREYAQSAHPVNASENFAPLSCQNCPETFVRQHLHYNAASPVCAERTSRPSDNFCDQPYFMTNNMPNDRKNERYSLDLCNIPQLQKQIRATSELCLQASRRHMFASSADIHKLFSGQIKAPKPVSSSSEQFWEDLHYNQSGPGSSLQRNTNAISPLTAQEISKRHVDQRLISTPSGFVRAMPQSSPIRTNHCYHFPLETSLYKTPLSFSLASEKYRTVSPTLPQSIEIYPDAKRHHFQRKGSACAETDTEQLLLQRQLSDYSSETELQLIESNAEAVKHNQGIQKSELPLHSSAKNFLPINTSLENDPKSSGVHHVTDIEPVYANGTVLATTTSDVVNTSSNSGWFREPATLGQPLSYVNPYFTSGLSKPCGSPYTKPYSPSQPTPAACTNHYLPSVTCTTIKPARFQSCDNIHSSTSSSDDPDTHDNNFSMNPISYSRLPAQNQSTVATSHSSPNHYQGQYHNVNQILYTKSRATPANESHNVMASNPRFGYSMRQSASCHDFTVPCGNRGGFFSPIPSLKTGQSMVRRNHSNAQEFFPGISRKNGYSSSGRHSVMDKPTLPFETNFVSEDEGDRLSTLV